MRCEPARCALRPARQADQRHASHARIPLQANSQSLCQSFTRGPRQRVHQAWHYVRAQRSRSLPARGQHADARKRSCLCSLHHTRHNIGVHCRSSCCHRAGGSEEEDARRRAGRGSRAAEGAKGERRERGASLTMPSSVLEILYVRVCACLQRAVLTRSTLAAMC
jgi:hypothetical protein